MTNEEIEQIFFVECEEGLTAAESGLSALQAGTDTPDTLNAVFRAIHSIKGGAGAFGFMPLQDYAHSIETLLASVRSGSVHLDGGLLDLLLRALDALQDHVAAARGQSSAPDDAALVAALAFAQTGEPVLAPEPQHLPSLAMAPQAEDMGAPEDANAWNIDAMLDDLVAELDPEFSLARSLAAEWDLFLRPHANAMCNGGEPLLALRELARLGGVCATCDVSAVPPLDELTVAEGYLGWHFQMPAAVSKQTVMDIFDFAPEDIEISFGEDATMPAHRTAPRAAPSPAPPLAAETNVKPGAAPSSATPQAQALPGSSIRIDLAKLDRLIDAVGELVIAQAMVAERLGDTIEAAADELNLLENLTRDIQENAMAIRAQPIGSVFSRIPRMLRELATTTGKHVRLEVQGEATELDKAVIERLNEPLMHLIRNAVDHGIEQAADRLRIGKDADGTLILSAEQRSGRILIRVSDDGAGIDRARVLAKAVEKGLVGPQAALTDEEIDALIFAPGFSTANNVSNISGRGVGMDVVLQNVKELGGRIAIASRPGCGTTFTLVLPLTLAISEAMIVSVGGETLVLPLAHIIESLQPTATDLHGIGRHQQMLNLRGHLIPIFSVHEGIGATGIPRAAQHGVLIVVETETAGRAALLVDDICDQRQVVIKSIGANYKSIDGIAGATILANGRVALILDVEGLVARATVRKTAQAA